MIVRFENKKALELYELDIKACVSKYKYASHIIEKYKLSISQLIDALDLRTISQIKSLNLEKLKGDITEQIKVQHEVKANINRALNRRKLIAAA